MPRGEAAGGLLIGFLIGLTRGGGGLVTSRGYSFYANGVKLIWFCSGDAFASQYPEPSPRRRISCC